LFCDGGGAPGGYSDSVAMKLFKAALAQSYPR